VRLNVKRKYVFDRWLAQLSPEHRGVIWRSSYVGWTTAQMDDDLQTAEGTVKSRLHHAPRALREMGATDWSFQGGAFARRGLTAQAADVAIDQACRMLPLPTIRQPPVRLLTCAGHPPSRHRDRQRHQLVRILQVNGGHPRDLLQSVIE
jgi:hypothetical protein